MRSRQRTCLRVLALALFTAAAITSCGSGEPDGSIQIHLEPIPAQPWIATGELVDSDVFCREGSRRLVGFELRDGTKLTFEEFRDLPNDDDVLGRQRWICANGSATFTTLEPMNAESGWIVSGGTGLLTGIIGERQLGPEDEVNGVIVSGTVELVDPDT